MYASFTFQSRLFVGGRVPRDSTIVIEERRNLETELYASLSSLAIAGIVMSCFFLIFNVLYRNTRFCLIN